MIRNIDTESIPRKAFSEEELATPTTLPTETINTKIAMPEKFGTENVAKWMSLATAIDTQVSEGKADGNWSTMDSFALASTILTRSIGAASGVGDLDDEARNLNRAEIAHLRTLIEPNVSEGIADIFEGALLMGTGALMITGKYIYNEAV